MINTKEELRYYLEEDKKAYHKTKPTGVKSMIRDLIFRDWNYEYVKNLRKWEYYYNSGGGQKYYYAWRCGRLKQKCGIDLVPNVAGPGLHIVHGKVVINAYAKIGSNCKILSDVTIGVSGKINSTDRPIIGNNVFIGSGARIIGGVTIADNVVIGANAVVTKSITEPGITVAGIPAKKISGVGSEFYI